MTKASENTGSNVEDPEVDAATLTRVAGAIRDREWIRFDYRPGQDAPSDTPPSASAAPSGQMLVEPYRLVSWLRRWYLVGRDPRADTWATYRVDWISLRMATGHRFRPIPFPEDDYTDFVLRDVASTGWKVHARITVLASADEVLARINSTVGVVESLDEQTCVLVTGADSLETIAVYVGMLGLDFKVSKPPGLVEHLGALGERYLGAIRP